MARYSARVSFWTAFCNKSGYRDLKDVKALLERRLPSSILSKQSMQNGKLPPRHPCHAHSCLLSRIAVLQESLVDKPAHVVDDISPLVVVFRPKDAQVAHHLSSDQRLLFCPASRPLTAATVVPSPLLSTSTAPTRASIVVAISFFRMGPSPHMGP